MWVNSLSCSWPRSCSSLSDCPSLLRRWLAAMLGLPLCRRLCCCPHVCAGCRCCCCLRDQQPSIQNAPFSGRSTGCTQWRRVCCCSCGGCSTAGRDSITTSLIGEQVGRLVALICWSQHGWHQALSMMSMKRRAPFITCRCYIANAMLLVHLWYAPTNVLLAKASGAGCRLLQALALVCACCRPVCLGVSLGCTPAGLRW